MRLLLLGIGTFFFMTSAFLQEADSVIQNYKFSSSIQTVKFHKKSNERGNPILSLGSNEKLMLRFDIMEEDFGDLAYEVFLCDKDWKKSKLDRYDYLDGYESVYIRNFDHSINTFVNYMNYRTEVPTSDFSLKMSGNYIIRVFPEANPEQTIIIRRFMVKESLINVDAKIVPPQVVMDRDYKQQIEFNIKYPSEISDPLSNLYVAIRQNNNWLTSMSNIQADYVRDQKLYFNDYSKFVFDGINEFRQIDLKYQRSGNLEIEKIVREGDQYHAYIKENKPRTYNNYSFKEEFNGKYIIKNDEATDQDLEADYFKVHFDLEANYFLEGEVYVFGELTNWIVSEEFKLEYNVEKRKYQLSKDVKQGMVNFCYMLFNKSTGEKNIEKIEGNHFATENDYEIILYYRDLSQENDRILGIYSFNSLY